MSEEVGKALQSVVERLKQAAARRPKVTTPRGDQNRVEPLLLRLVSQSHGAANKKKSLFYNRTTPTVM